jgi:hypothetical protein
MPNQSNLAINKGVISALIHKNKVGSDGVARSQANTLFRHQDFSSVQNYVDDRVQVLPVGNPTVKLGDEITFEFIPDADGCTEVDFRTTLPALMKEPPYYHDELLASNNTRPPNGVGFLTDENSTYWAGYADNVVFKTTQGNNYSTNSDFIRYRIPNNPAAKFLKDKSDYAVCAGGPCGIDFAGPVPDIFNQNIVEACRPPSFYQADNGVFLANTPFGWPQQAVFSDGGSTFGANMDKLCTKSYDLPCPLYADYIGYWMLERINVYQSTNALQNFSGYNMFLFDQAFHNFETSEHYAELTGAWHPDINGGKWSSLDIALCRQPREIIVPLDFLFWVGRITQFLPVIALHQAITMKIKLRSQEFCMLFEKLQYPIIIANTTVNAVPTVIPIVHSHPVILSHTLLEMHKFHYADIHRTKLLADLDSPTGLTWKCWDVDQLLNIPVASTTKGGVAASLSLLGIRNGVTSFFFTKIHSLDRTTPNAVYWTNFLRVNNFQIIAGRDEITPLSDHKYVTVRMQNLYNNSSFPKYSIYFHHFSKNPADKFNAWGHVEFGNLYNPVLNLNYKTNFQDPSSFYNAGEGLALRKNYLSNGSPVDSCTGDTNLFIPFAADPTAPDHFVDIVCITHQQIQIKSGNVIKHFN